MRRLLVPLVLVGSILLVQSPAHAYHRFYQISSPLKSIGDNLRITVDTNCKKGQKFALRSDSLGFFASRPVPPAPRFGPRAGISRLKLTGPIAAKSATDKATFTATCNGHHLCPEKKDPCPNAIKSRSAQLLLPQELVEPSELSSTGTSTLRLLTLGLCLVLAGGLLIALGRRRKA
jgi:hypothetical protein